MATNEFNIRRVAFGNAVYPPTTIGSDSSDATSLALIGAYIPKGAIVTGIRFFPYSQTDEASFLNAVVNVYCGGQALGTNNRKASEALIDAKAGTMAVAAGSGYVSVGGPLYLYFGASNNRTGISGDCDVYVDYLYCADRDAA